MEKDTNADAAGAPLQPSDEVVADFWGFARDHVGWATVGGIFGQQQASTMIPPWMHLSGDAAQATSMVNRLVSEGTLVVEEPISSYPEDGDLPKRGDLAVIVDGDGRPIALAATLDVTVKPVDASEGTGRIVAETLRCLYPGVR